jgi:voltage-gated potassium channel
MSSTFRAYGVSAILIAALLLLGPLGFVVIEDFSYFDGLYMTVITVSTVGFQELHPMSDAGHLYIIFLIVFGIGATTYIVREVTKTIIEGQLRNVLGKRKMGTQLKKLSDHTIIAGYGRVGQEVVSQFLQTPHKDQFVVIENDRDAIEKLSEEKILYVEGDVTVDETLRNAGLESAKTIVSTVPGDADNVYLALTARHLNPNIHVIARADHTEAERKLLRAGANQVVSPHSLGGLQMANLAIRPSLVHFFHSLAAGEEGLGVEETLVAEKSQVAGKTLKELDLRRRENLTVIGIRKSHQAFMLNPDVDTIIEAGDLMLLIGEPDNLLRFSEQC